MAGIERWFDFARLAIDQLETTCLLDDQPAVRGSKRPKGRSRPDIHYCVHLNCSRSSCRDRSSVEPSFTEPSTSFDAPTGKGPTAHPRRPIHRCAGADALYRG